MSKRQKIENRMTIMWFVLAAIASLGLLVISRIHIVITL
jgi:hypothetical protein